VDTELLPHVRVPDDGVTIDPSITQRYDDAVRIQRIDGGVLLKFTVPHTAVYHQSARQSTMSLRKEQARLGFTCILRLEQLPDEGEEKKYQLAGLRFQRTHFTVSDNLSYEDFYEILNDTNHPLHDQITLLIEIAQDLAGPGIDWTDLPRAVITVLSRFLNTTIAEFARQNRLTMIYWCAKEGRTWYDIEPGNFFEIPAYLRWTSPLRREEDRLNQLTLFNFLQGKPDPEAQARAKEFVARANREMREIESQLAAQARARQRFKNELMRTIQSGSVSEEQYLEATRRIGTREFSDYVVIQIFISTLFTPVQGEWHHKLWMKVRDECAQDDRWTLAVLRQIGPIGRGSDLLLSYDLPDCGYTVTGQVIVDDKEYFAFSVKTPKRDAIYEVARTLLNDVLTDISR